MVGDMGGKNVSHRGLKVGDNGKVANMTTFFIRIKLEKRDDLVRVGSEQGVLGKRVRVAMAVGDGEGQGLQPGGA